MRKRENLSVEARICAREVSARSLYDFTTRLQVQYRMDDLLRVILGRPDPRVCKNRKKTGLPSGYKGVLKCLLRVFTVNDDFTWAIQPQRFTTDGYRDITRKEFERMAKVSRYQITQALAVFEQQGVIDRYKERDWEHPGRYRAFYRLNGCRLLELLEQVAQPTDKRPEAPLPTGEAASAEILEQLTEAEKDEFVLQLEALEAQAQAELEKAGAMPDNRQIHISTKDSASGCPASGCLAASADAQETTTPAAPGGCSSSRIPEAASNEAGQPEAVAPGAGEAASQEATSRESVAPGADEIAESTNACYHPDFNHALALLMAGAFPFETLTAKHRKQLYRYFNIQSPRLQFSLERVKFWLSYRQNHSDEPLANGTLDAFCQFWPSFLKAAVQSRFNIMSATA